MSVKTCLIRTVAIILEIIRYESIITTPPPSINFSSSHLKDLCRFLHILHINSNVLLLF